MPHMTVLSDKLAFWRENAANYDTLFIGTSRTFYHIDPVTVAASAAAEGCPDVRAFNFGVYGLNGAELDWLVDEVLSAPGGDLRTVVLEDPLPQAHTMADTTNTRSRWFHAPAYWRGALGNIASYPESLPKRIFRTGIFVYGAGFDLSGAGLGAALAFPPAYTWTSTADYLDMDGYEPLGTIQTDNIRARRAEFLANPDGFTAAMARYGAPSDEAVTARADYLVERLRAIEARGIEATFYVSPELIELDRTPRIGAAVAEIAPDMSVLNYNQPDLYPDLFKRDQWHDFSHLLPAGAERLSARVGADLCRSLKRTDGGMTDAVR
ncbi:MAG: hypothetical protein RLO80_13280 [Hyphomonas sp.]